MKYVVTGAGMLGSQLAAALRDEGNDVVVGDRAGGAGVVAVDQRNPDAVADLLAGADGVFHTAAVHGFRDAATREFFEANVMGTWTLCDAAVAAGVPRLVHSSTIGVYGDADHLAVDSDAQWAEAISAYNLTKQLAEQVVDWYARTTPLHTVALRYGGFVQTIAEEFGEIPAGWRRSGALVDLVDVVAANLAAMQGLPLPRRAYLVVPSGGEPTGPYMTDASETEADLGMEFRATYAAIRDGMWPERPSAGPRA